MAKLHIFAGSVYGNAQHVAEEVSDMLTRDGVECELFSDPSVDDFTQADAILVITSTTGQGDIPPNLEFVHAELKASFPLLTDTPFAVAALGDSSYDTFCGGGLQFQELLTELQAKPVAEMLKVDALETFEPEQIVKDWVAGIKDNLI
ncbi:flavodoxin [Alteromonas ponticola]|uniref:Flavodoxin n=1 Tax=Alteromonas aquimaris TaxID=2998417 RepID=A0ABT3P630_9ALTE|nr:flavodoxin [Alteromonas aquimaris]MCW8107536.1 flavodoxin [Alteromonas aquimaris]